MASLRAGHERWKSAPRALICEPKIKCLWRPRAGWSLTIPCLKHFLMFVRCESNLWPQLVWITIQRAACCKKGLRNGSIRCLKSALGIELKSLFPPSPAAITFYDYEVSSFTSTRFISKKLAGDGWRCQAYNKLLLRFSLLQLNSMYSYPFAWLAFLTFSPSSPPHHGHRFLFVFMASY